MQELKDMYEEETSHLPQRLRDTQDALHRVIERAIALRQRLATHAAPQPAPYKDRLLNEDDHRPRGDADGDVWTRRENGLWGLEGVDGPGTRSLAQVHGSYGIVGFARVSS